MYLYNEQMLNHFLHVMRTTHPTNKKYTQNIDSCEKIPTSEQTVTTLKWEGVFFLGLCLTGDLASTTRNLSDKN